MTRGKAVHTKLTGCRVPLLMTAASGGAGSEHGISKPRCILGLKFSKPSHNSFRMQMAWGVEFVNFKLEYRKCAKEMNISFASFNAAYLQVIVMKSYDFFSAKKMFTRCRR